jgi:DNA-binding beta-propeller fold protein YncE
LSGEIPAVAATGLIGLVSCSKTDTVIMFDKATGRVFAVVPTGRGPRGIALSQSRRRAYVALAGDDAVEAIDLLEAAVVDRVQLRQGDAPVELVLTPEDAAEPVFEYDLTPEETEDLARTPKDPVLLTVNRGSDSVSYVDPEALFETGRVPVERGPSSLSLDRTGRRAFVFNSKSDTISILPVNSILTRSDQVPSVAIESEPLRGHLNKAGDRLYVVHGSGPHLSIMDPLQFETIGKVYVGTGATALTVDPRTDRIYIARRGTGMIEVYDPFSLLPVDSIRTDEEVGYLAIDPEENRLHIVLSRANRIRTVHLVGTKTATELDVTGAPYWVTFMGER